MPPGTILVQPVEVPASTVREGKKKKKKVEEKKKEMVIIWILCGIFYIDYMSIKQLKKLSALILA